MKKKRKLLCFTRGSLSKIVLRMKILTFLIFTAFAVSAADSYSQATKFNLKLKDATVKEVFKHIEENSEFILLYNEKWVNVNRRLDITASNETVEKILDQTFKGTRNVYKIYDRQIVILKDEKEDIQSFRNENFHLNSKSEIQQQKEISGKVTGSDGIPIPGVSIIVKGTTIGTITDSNGEFSLRIPPNAEILQFSFVGMLTQEIPVEEQTTFTIVMEEQTIGLEEIVAVGYGVQKRESVTGAISTVETEQLQQSTSASLGASLAGRISGLVITQQGGGQPGFDDPQIYLRGMGTLNTSSPLILIDGVPRDNMRQIDPREIESVAVLKDASATAVFGVRGANGAIIITTKRGQLGKPQLTVSAEQGFTSFTREDEPINSVEWIKIYNEVMQNDGLPTDFTDEVIAKYENPLIGLDPNSPDYETKKAQRLWMYPNNDWYRMLIKRQTPETRVSAGVSGGTDKISYYGYAGFLNQGGNLITEDPSDLGYNPQVYNKRFSFRG
ncbi:MAG: SusC/RagA family TonB-linked outer membrane protein, partial [Mariniphaga sp.]|nr:SusC/RagA family TonB-linked outer membrane protein [Mariniphaga sp.]